MIFASCKSRWARKPALMLASVLVPAVTSCSASVHTLHVSEPVLEAAPEAYTRELGRALVTNPAPIERLYQPLGQRMGICQIRTPADWDFGDFIPAAVQNVGRYNLKTHTKGGNDIYGIPGLHSGSVIYFYRKDLFDAAGLGPAKTWDEFMAAAKQFFGTQNEQRRFADQAARKLGLGPHGTSCRLKPRIAMASE